MNRKYLAILGGSLLASAPAFAANVTPAYDTFSNLAGATFGGSGNPTDPVAITTINTMAGDTITLGLAAQQRYFNPPLSNDGAGMYFATAGQNNGLGSSSYQGATWNFDYYVDIENGQTPEPYHFTLSYGTDASSLVSINPLNVGDNAPTPNSGGQNSENLLFPAFGNLSSFELNPLISTFDPNANADYSFVLEAFDAGGNSLGKSAIVVRVGTGSSVPDGGSTVTLLGVALAGVSSIRRKMSR